MLRFPDFYKKGSGARFSVEIFPPHSEPGYLHLLQELEQIKPFNPAFISVTYGAMGSTRDKTRDLVLQIRDELKLTTAFHFTCVGFGKAQIREYVTDLSKRGINLIVALRGDIPPGMGDSFQKPVDGFCYASELVEFLRECGGFSMAVAGYPEKHTEAVSFERDIENLKRKVDFGGEIVITQLFFDNSCFERYLERVRKHGVTCPVIPGILPIQSYKQLDRIVRMSGASLPTGLKRDLDHFRDDPQAIAKIGMEHAIGQCRDLLQKGSLGIHIYSLNKAAPALGIIEGCQEFWSRDHSKSD